MVLLIYINKRDMKKNAETIVDETDSEESKIVLLSTKKSVIFFILGLVGVVGGGVLTTFGAENLSVNLLSGLFGMEISKAKTLIGLSVVAIGTSLPELVTSVVALRKKETELSIGNVVGSNIFNILMIVGLAGTVFPLSANKDVLLDALICLGLSIIFSVLIMFVNKIGKKTGIFFLCFFIAYITFIILRALEVFVIW
jgi:cation:H+ antiporter